MKQPVLFRRDDTISYEAAMYWKDILYRTIKIGTEVEFAMPKGVRKSDFRPPLVEELQPSQDLNNLGKYGVYDIVTEHCGIEIQVIGRQPYYPALIEQYRAIMNPLLEHGVRARYTCGLHYHALAIGLSEPELYTVDVESIYSQGDLGQMVFLQRGDIVVVPTKTITNASRFFREVSGVLSPFVAGSAIYRNAVTGGAQGTSSVLD